jgi:thiamine-phosphate pyrophosphorylase
VSSAGSLGTSRRERLRAARLYLALERRPPGPRSAEELVEAALAGGVDMVQLRDKQASDDDLLRAAELFRRVCDRHGALFWLNDRPDLAEAAGADGVHVGQDDMPVAEVRRVVGPDVLIGLSTHSPEQLGAALGSEADELSVGPVYATPTKEGRPAAGLDYVRHAARVAEPGTPWFAIGGIDFDNVRDVVEAGAQRIVVVRAIRDAEDPRAAAAGLRAALDRRAVGTAG